MLLLDLIIVIFVFSSLCATIKPTQCNSLCFRLFLFCVCGCLFVCLCVVKCIKSTIAEFPCTGLIWILTGMKHQASAYSNFTSISVSLASRRPNDHSSDRYSYKHHIKGHTIFHLNPPCDPKDLKQANITRTYLFVHLPHPASYWTNGANSRCFSWILLFIMVITGPSICLIT